MAGRGVAGDAHMGTTVQHLSRIKADPAQPNLRQVCMFGQFNNAVMCGHHMKRCQVRCLQIKGSAACLTVR